MWPSQEFWSVRGFNDHEGYYLYKQLLNKWQLCVSTKDAIIPTTPPIGRQALDIVAYEPDGNTATFTFSMQPDCSINPETMLAALLKAIEKQILA